MAFTKKPVICCMKMLVVAATEAEVAPFTAYLHTSGMAGVTVLTSGVGMMATAYSLTKHLSNYNYDLALQVGVAGSYDDLLALGDLVLVATEQYGDLGAEDHDNYIDIFEMGLLSENSVPHTDGKLTDAPSPFLDKITLPHVSGLTVNTTSGNEHTIKRRRTKFNCQVETMEGAAFHYVCLREGVPFAQVRAISNYVTPRDKSVWKMKEAIGNLNRWLIDFIERTP